MFPQKLLWASLGLAMLGCGPLVSAEDAANGSLSPEQSLPATQQAGAPIPQAAGAKTQRDLLEQYLDWSRRRLLPSTQVIAKGQPWESAAVKFVDDSFAVWGGIEQTKTPEALAALAARGDELIKSGCNEALVRYETLRATPAARDRNAQAGEYRRILEELEKDPRYPRALASQVAVNLRYALPASNAALDGRIIELMRQSYEEGSYSGADDTLFVNDLFSASDLLARNSDAMEKLVTGLQKLPEWARETILGKVEVDRAWHARGGGWADSVTEEGWKGFGESLSKAHAHLEAAWKARPDQPYAAAEMITVVMGSEQEPSSALRVWFDRTVTARFDFPTAYTAYSWGIRPRWGGSHEEMLAFGRACAATKRFDTSVPQHLIKIVDDIGKELSTRREVYELPAVAKEVLAVDKGYAEAPGQAPYRKYRYSALLFDAWLSRQWDEAKAALDHLPDQQLDPSLRERMLHFGAARNNVIGETVIYNGPAKEDYAKARDLEREERYADAAPRYAAVLKIFADQSPARDLVTFLSEINETRLEMEKGEWKEISPNAANLGEWTLSAQGICTVPEDGVLQVVGKRETTVSRWRRPLGENYEMRATFEFLSPPENPHLFGVVLGESSRHKEEYVTCQFYSDQKTKGKVQLLHGFNNAQNPIFETELQMKNDLRIQCWQGRLNIYLNGKIVCENFKPAEGAPGDHYGELGFGGYKLSAEEGFRVSKIAVRVLKAEPAAPEGGRK